MLSQFEKVVIDYHLLMAAIEQGKPDWGEIFAQAHPGKELSKKSMTEATSRWRKQADVVACVTEIEAKMARFLTIQRETNKPKDVVSEIAQLEPEMAKNRNRKEILADLNRLVDLAPDIQTKAKCYDLIYKYQTEEERAENAEKDIMRFYVPVTCYECPLYKERKEMIEKGIIKVPAK